MPKNYIIMMYVDERNNYMQRIKKVISVFIITVLIVTGAYNSGVFNVNAEKIVTAYIEGSDVRVRNTPSTASSSSIIEKISNTSAQVLDSVKNSEGLWYKITYHNGTKQITGYIFYDASYVKIVEYNPDASFEEQLKAFPASYHTALKTLHAAYPNWEFTPDPVATSFSQAIADQSYNMRKQVQVTSNSVSWRAMTTGSYDWSTGKWSATNGGWTGASREVIAYYMDPRSFLNSSEVFQFMQQTYTSQTTEADVDKVISGTFMANGYKTFSGDSYGGSYAKLLIAAGKSAGVDPCVLAAAIIQEQGSKGTSSLISGTYKGYEGYYNFFNVSASGSTTSAVIVNGLKKAKAEGWNSIPASIIGGAKFFKTGYITRYNNALKNQDTYYYQDFNVHNPKELWHQYAQAVHDANSKGSILKKAYQSQKNYALKFRIPVFTDMPSTASPKPAQNTKTNNYYFSDITVSGLTPSFSMFNYTYSLSVTGDTTVYVKPVSKATYAGNGSYTLKKGDNTVTLKVKSETGYITDYTVKVNATKACKLTISTGTPSDSGNGSGNNSGSSSGSDSSTPSVTVKKGDTNGDGTISIRDLANIRLHLLGIVTLSGNNLKGADTNLDNKVTIRDLANVRLHLLGISLLK